MANLVQMMKNKHKEEWRIVRWIKNNSKRFYYQVLLKFNKYLTRTIKKIEKEIDLEDIKMRINTPEGTRKKLDELTSRLMKMGCQEDAKTIREIKDKLFPHKTEADIENEPEVKENEPEPEKNV